MFITFLFKIGIEESFISKEGKPHHKAREIGKLVDKIGGITLMQRVSRIVVTALQRKGLHLSRELEHCWDGIGDWFA